jgi:16S rRNA C967 or C1407 C5-methylase (RsmB/RsmF family)
MDPFIEAFEAARSRLIAKERQNVSVREVLRRAGITESERPGASYHLNKRKHTGDKPHQVPPWLVRKLATALPVRLADLEDAARASAGFQQIEERPSRTDVTYMVQRFYGDEEVTPEERAAVTARLLQILAEESARHTAPANSDGNAAVED